jgi:hypothetical protein
MEALRSRETSFHGDDECSGMVGSRPCARALRFNAVATFAPVLRHMAEDARAARQPRARRAAELAAS